MEKIITMLMILTWVFNSVITTEIDTVVVECNDNGNGIYTVAVIDREGNCYEYYDDEEREICSHIICILNGNQEIVDVKELKED